jgi:hypothetical protein
VSHLGPTYNLRGNTDEDKPVGSAEPSIGNRLVTMGRESIEQKVDTREETRPIPRISIPGMQMNLGFLASSTMKGIPILSIDETV